MNNFDPQTGVPVTANKVVKLVNTRTFMYHKVRPAIVVEGEGNTDPERRADVVVKIKAAEAQGYRLERFDGQHPHSFDAHRMDDQQRRAEEGDEAAKAALAAKAKLSKPSRPPTK